jgi:hypothetical protein
MAEQHYDYYTYAYLRDDKTPYYIGKGKGERAFKRGRGESQPPKDLTRILFLKKNLTEAEAFKHEVYMIFVLGRKDLGTGILRNLTNGGEGASGAVRSEETKKRYSESKTGENNSMHGRTGENHPRFGVPHTEEQKKAHSERMSKAIIAIAPDGAKLHYGSGREAARDLGFDQGHLSRYAKSGHVLTQGPRKGWRFIFENR